MIFVPRALGNHTLNREDLEKDKKKCLKVGPCGLGKKAMYLNSFYIDRQYYIPYVDVQRCFKRVAMSKGGYTGKGVFSTIPYLVVQYNNGQEKQCNFKYEEEVDTFLQRLHMIQPRIRLHSAEAEEKIRIEERKEQAKYISHLSPKAKESIKRLDEAKKLLEGNIALSYRLASSAKHKRAVDYANPSYKIVAILILIAGLGMAIYGIASLMQGGDFALYFLLFGMAFTLLVMASRVLPTGRNNKRYVQEQWDDSVKQLEKYIERDDDFPLPAHYAHPVTLTRMIRAIKMGRAESVEDALEVVKEDLKALNSEVEVSQREYDEVVEIKPIFLLCNYQ
ncbi:MAG: hypothetical protein IJ875_07580 [Solobacterium sp.]|nr:hypothetical protein [Solobacterium sp.]